MQSLKLTSFKDREKRLLRKNVGLVSELKAHWNRKIPPSAASSIPWMIFQAAISDLSPHLPKETEKSLLAVAGKRSVRELMRAQSLGSPQSFMGDPRGYFATNCCLNLFKKFPWGEGELTPAATAIERFWLAEKRCRQTNRRLLHYRQFDFSGFRPLTKRLNVHEVFHLARKKIQNWIGPVPPSSVFSLIRHGPGGCVGLKRPDTTPYYKFGKGSYTVSQGAYWHAVREIVKHDSWVRALSHESGTASWEHPFECVPFETKVRLVDQRIAMVDYNEVTFVPKDAKTHRSIAIEPRLNVALQLSVGTFFKECLKRAGCDLTDQTRNQELARIGSLTSSDGDSKDPVTIDLEMASDTLSIELVRELLPVEWFELLDDLRSREGLLQKTTVVKWEKFSSMGNGFTFELESMIFYALAQAVSDTTDQSNWFSDTFGPAYRYAYVSVFGDDIIVPGSMAAPLIEVLRFCGFRTNLEKTFLSGPFRESCGKDYFDGVPVRSFLFKRKLDRQRDLIHLRNGLKKMATHRGVNMDFTIQLVDSLLSPTLRKHLCGWTETDSEGYIWRELDLCHQSRLVVYDIDFQSMVHPVMRESPIAHRGRLTWRYLQFLYAETGRVLRAENTFYVKTDALADHLSQGGSSGDVIRSGITQPALRLMS